MPPQDFQVPLLLDYTAAVAWALSGAIVGMRKGYDIVGVFVVALLSSVVGGLLRDGLFLNRTPVAVSSPFYLLAVTLVTLFVALFWRWYARLHFAAQTPQMISLIDSIGTPAFAIVGMQLSLEAKISLPGVILIGVINGVGGGILRDVLVNQDVTLLRPGQYYAVVVFGACITFLVLTLSLHINANWAAWSVIALFLAVRILIVRYNWRTRPVFVEPDL